MIDASVSNIQQSVDDPDKTQGAAQSIHSGPPWAARRTIAEPTRINGRCYQTGPAEGFGICPLAPVRPEKRPSPAALEANGKQRPNKLSPPRPACFSSVDGMLLPSDAGSRRACGVYGRNSISPGRSGRSATLGFRQRSVDQISGAEIGRASCRERV